MPFQFIDAAGNTKYSSADGDGTLGNPYIQNHKDTVTSGSIYVTNMPATQAVSGSVVVVNTSLAVNNLPAIQNVSGSTTVADGGNTTLGYLDDQAILGNAEGSVNARLRGIGTIFDDVWDDDNKALRIIQTSSASSTVGINNFPASQVISGSVTVLNSTSSSSVVVTSGSVYVLNNSTSTASGSTFVSGGSVNISNSIAISNLPTSQQVSGSVSVNSGSISVVNFPSNQTISGSVTVLNSTSSSSVVVTSGSVYVLNNGTSVSSGSTFTTGGSVNVLNFPDTQKISGSVTVLNNTSSSSVVVTSGSIYVLNNSVSSGSTSVTGGSINVVNFPSVQPISGSVSVTNFPSTQVISGSTVVTSGSIYVLNNSTVASSGSSFITGGSTNVINFPETQKVSGSLTITSMPSQTLSGSVSVNSGSINVINFPTTQQISGSVTILSGGTSSSSVYINNSTGSPVPVNIVSGTITSGSDVYITNSESSPVQTSIVSSTILDTNAFVSNFPETQTISGSVTSNMPVNATTGALGSMLLRLTDGDGNYWDAVGSSEGMRVYIGGTIISSDETTNIYNGTQNLTPQFKTIVASSSGNTTILSAVVDKKIRILSMTLTFSGGVNVKFQSNNSTDITGILYGVTGIPLILPYNKLGLFQTVAGELLNINLSESVAVGGFMTYIEV
jgi:hypothetical protein